MLIKTWLVRRPALILVWLAIFSFRLTLIYKGHFHLQDELRYRYSFALLREVAAGNFWQAGEQLFQFPLYARPLLPIFNLPTAMLQGLFLLITGVKTETPLSLGIASGMQVLTSLGLSLVVYLLAKRYLKSEFFAAVGMLGYSLLINSNLYVRHILPYDSILFWYLFWLYVVLRRYKQWSWWRLSAGSGLVAALGYLVYPADYLFVPILAVLTTLLPLSNRWQRGGLFLASFGGVMGMTEAFSRVMSRSYLADVKFLASRVVVGDPNETLIFLYRYLWVVEGLMGKLLIVLFSLFLGWMILKWRQLPREFRWLAVAVVGTYLFHGFSGLAAGKVFYGRSVRMFFWFVVVGSMLLLKEVARKWRWQTLPALLLGLVSLVSFVQWYPKFLRLSYPGDVLYSVCQIDCQAVVSEVNENYSPTSVENHPIEEPRYLGVNFGRWFFPEAKRYEYDPDSGELIFQAPHPINFVAYQFEGLSPKERKLIQERNYQMKLYLMPSAD